MPRINSPEDCDFIVQKLPSDMGIHRNPRKGTLNAPEEILNGFEFKDNVLVDEVFPDEFNLEESHLRIRENTEELVEYGKPVISVGGDHSVSFPVISALKESFPDLKLVWLDSHLDLKEKVDGHVSHDVVVRELLENGFSEDEVVFVGVTRVDEDEKGFLDSHDIEVYYGDEVEEFLREFETSEQPVYASVDIDVLSEDLAPGTGYPGGELEVEVVLEILETVSPDFGDIVEVAPPLDDEDERTLESSRSLLKGLVKEIREK